VVVLWKWKVCCFLFVWIVFSAIRSMHGRFVGSCNDEGSWCCEAEDTR